MNVFDLLFLSLVLATVLTLLFASGFAFAGQRLRALRLLRRLGFGTILYFSVIILVSLWAPRRTYQPGETQCFDDWCIAVISANRTSPSSYSVGLRISSRAARVSQRERNLLLYLTDSSNHRYPALVQPSDIPLDSLLQPGDSVDLSRTFPISSEAKKLNLVVSHSGFPIGWFIIGYNSWFRGPPVVILPPGT